MEKFGLVDTNLFNPFLKTKGDDNDIKLDHQLVDVGDLLLPDNVVTENALHVFQTQTSEFDLDNNYQQGILQVLESKTKDEKKKEEEERKKNATPPNDKE
jgi:hypothetical protein